MNGKATAQVIESTLTELLADAGMSKATTASFKKLIAENRPAAELVLQDLKLSSKFNESKLNKFIKFVKDLQQTAELVVDLANTL